MLVEMSTLEPYSLTIDIQNMLNSSPSIFRVHHNLRSTKPEAYDPKIIAIGPFHRGKPQLQEMERHKLRYLNLLLQRKPELRQPDFTSMMQLEERARRCYQEDIDLSRFEFLLILILDACFILEFLRKFRDREINDPIFQYPYIQPQLFHDLIVFENQIPFFVVKHFFRMTKDNEEILKELIWHLLQNGIYRVKQLPQGDLDGPHLLAIVHHVQCSSFANSDTVSVAHNDNDNDKHIPSAVELKQAGIAFKKSEGNSLFHIEFKNKKLIIPPWEIYDSTESLFRNLIAYEQHLTGDGRKRYVSDYVDLMQCLVHSPEDTKSLRRSGIIHNYLGGDEILYGLISQLSKNVIVSDSYSDIFYRVNQHCKCKRYAWMAMLRRDYFNSPWSFFSLFGAIALLVLTITQATFAILSYRNDLKHGNTTLPHGKP